MAAFLSGLVPLTVPTHSCRVPAPHVAEWCVSSAPTCLLLTVACAVVQDGATPVFAAAMAGHLDVVKALVAAGCDVNAPTAVRHFLPALPQCLGTAVAELWRCCCSALAEGLQCRDSALAVP